MKTIMEHYVKAYYVREERQVILGHEVSLISSGVTGKCEYVFSEYIKLFT